MKIRFCAALLLAALISSIFTGCSVNALQQLDAAEDAIDRRLDAVENHIENRIESAFTEAAVPMAPEPATQADSAQPVLLTKEEAEKITATMIAIPGTSEHHTGLAADIVTPTHQTLDPEFADTAAGKWLQENAAEYGFILRYPEDKQDITKIIYESWHYRYVGVDHAKAITENELCLEEYLEILKEGGLEKDGEL